MITKPYLWQLHLEIPFELEESFLWKLENLGIVSFSFSFMPGKGNTERFSIWLPYPDWSVKELKELMECLIQLAEAFEVVLPFPKWEKVEPEDWNLTWKKHWEPDPIGKKLLILPEWIEIPQNFKTRKVVRIDPGSAFGTGSHPSTRLCLEFLESEPIKGLYVVDLGCGSGILGLTALAFGAKKVFAVDIDSFAISSSNRNFLLNDYESDSFVVSKGSIDSLHMNLKKRKSDLLLCNILAPIIKELIPSFNGILSSRGSALLSGILIEQVNELEQTLNLYGWRIFRRWYKRNWVSIEVYRS